MDPILYSLVIVFCLGASAFFSSSETALLRLREDEIEHDAADDKGGPAVHAAKHVTVLPVEENSGWYSQRFPLGRL